jgi:hypothetical protein
MKSTKTKATKKAARAEGWSHADTNEEIAEKHPPYGTPAYNLYYTIGSLPPVLADAISDTLSNLAKTLDVPDPTATNGEVLGFRRLVKLCKAAADQEEESEQE